MLIDIKSLHFVAADIPSSLELSISHCLITTILLLKKMNPFGLVPIQTNIKKMNCARVVVKSEKGDGPFLESKNFLPTPTQVGLD